MVFLLSKLTPPFREAVETQGVDMEEAQLL